MCEYLFSQENTNSFCLKDDQLFGKNFFDRTQVCKVWQSVAREGLQLLGHSVCSVVCNYTSSCKQRGTDGRNPDRVLREKSCEVKHKRGSMKKELNWKAMGSVFWSELTRKYRKELWAVLFITRIRELWLVVRMVVYLDYHFFVILSSGYHL